jgi:hypothetical protein
MGRGFPGKGYGRGAAVAGAGELMETGACRGASLSSLWSLEAPFIGPDAAGG